MSSSPYDAIVVGAGPAGLSAALVLGRARRSVLVCDEGRPRNAVVERMHGFLTRDGERPGEMARIAREELACYRSVSLIDQAVTLVCQCDDGFIVTLASGERAAGRRLLLASGVVDELPAVEGLPKRWGRSVFVCPFCDGWEVQDQRIAVCGRGREAVCLAEELYAWTHDLVVCPDVDNLTERDRAWIAASGSTLHIGTLKRFAGADDSLERIEFLDGSVVQCAVAFVSAPLRQHSPLFASLGCALTPEGSIAVDVTTNETSIRGCYAAGDAVTPVHQVIVAAASGARAAIAMTADLLQADADALARTFFSSLTALP